MIRLIFKQTFSEDTDIKFPYLRLMRTSRSDAKSSEETIKKLDAFNSINNYNEFLNKLKEESSRRVSAIYEVSLDNDTIYLFKRSNSNDMAKFILKYHPENNQLLNLTKIILKLDDSKKSTYLISSPDNNFNLIAPAEVLRVLYSYNNILAKGEIPFLKFKLTSKNGKVRDIVAPHDEIKSSLRQLNTVFQKVYDSRNNIQVAYKKGNSVKTGALMHKDNKYVFNMDLKDFYPSCKKELVEKYINFLFKNAYNRDYIEKEFLNIILINDGLFIGSPISGTLANAILSKTIMYLNAMCKKYNVTLSVYADDISFSSEKFISEDFVMGMFNEAFIKYGLDSYFTINSKKSLGYSGSRRKITGLSINDSNQVTVPRKYYRELRVTLDKLHKGDNSINIQKLRGKIAYALMVDDSGKVLNYLKKFKDTVEQFSLYSGEL